ncbi:hypothetical protein Tco_1257192, partial [Tanacetum coccineum]
MSGTVSILQYLGLAEHQKSSEGQRLPFLADLCINTYHEWQIHHRYQVAKRQQEELENNKKKQQEELENNKNNNTKKNKKKKGLLKEVQTKKKNRINKGKQMDCLTAPLIGFLDVLSLSLSLLPVQLILKLLGKRHGKCTDFVRAVRKIIDSFEELRQHKQVDGVIALRQTEASELKEGRKKDPSDVSRCIQILYQAIG